MTGAQTFFVKKGYVCNENARTYEKSQSGEYWNQQRIRSAEIYQYHVYQLAGHIASKRGYRRVLDLGCGPATKAKTFLAPVVECIYLVDQPNCLQLATETLPDAHYYAADLEVCDLSLDKDFDLIVCADVLEHLFDPANCLKFALRHISPDGLVVFSTPERDILRGVGCMNSPHPAHVREWNGSEFQMLLEYSGFNVIQHHLLPARRLFFMEDWVRRLIPGDFQLKRWTSCQVAVCQTSSL